MKNNWNFWAFTFDDFAIEPAAAVFFPPRLQMLTVSEKEETFFRNYIQMKM